MKLPFNFNNYVLVRLNDAGYAHWKAEDDAIWEYGNMPHKKKSIEDYKKRADKDGYISFQLWSFIQTFWSNMYNGSEPLFELDFYVTMDTSLFDTPAVGAIPGFNEALSKAINGNKADSAP
jgi:hypothetical protein